MPPTPLIYRPQTLKQAKRAYHKSGGTVRLSESEKAVLERRAVLQERADRIKEREARRKANLKRKEERVQREREARHRMGIPTPPPGEGIQVGPSQLHLSGFMYAGEKRKREEEKEKEAGIPKKEELAVQDQQEYPIQPSRLPEPLQKFSSTASPTSMTPSQIVNADSPNVREFTVQKNRTPPNQTPPARNPLQSRSANPTMQPKPMTGNKNTTGVQPKASHLQEPQTSPMCPEETWTTRLGNPHFIRLPPKPPKPDSIPDDNFDDFFVSNTQIQRELSPPPAPPAIPTIQPPTPPPPLPLKASPANEDTADLLSLISTQDLDFSIDHTQIAPATASRHEPGFHTSSSDHNDEEEEEGKEEEDFPDSELEEIVLDFSLESPIKSPSTTPHETSPKTDFHPRTHSDSCNSDNAEITEADLQTVLQDFEREETQYEEAQGAAEWDIFELSTQDLIELAS